MALIDRLTDIGDAIREKNGTTELIPLVDMPQAILDIAGGGGGIEYTSITYNADDTITLIDTDGNEHTIVCEYDGDKLVCATYDGEAVDLAYEGDELTGIGETSIDLFPIKVRSELEVRNAGDNVSTIMGTKLNDGVAIYGIGYDDNMISGIWYSAYLISRNSDATLTSNVSGSTEFTYNGETWFYATKRTNTSDTTTYTDGIVVPYDAKKLSGKNAATAILDHYFYVGEDTGNEIDINYQNGFALGLVSNGKAQGTDTSQLFWDSYQDNGNRVDYSTAFSGIGWNTDTFKPRYDIKPTNAYFLFRGSAIEGDLVDILESLGVVLDTSKTTNTQYLFQLSLFTRIGTIDVTSATHSVATDNMCNGCTNLVRFEKLVVNEKTKFAVNTFSNCSALEYIGFEGAISNSLYLQYSPLLTAECVQGIIDHLATVTTAQTLTLHANIVLSDEQKAEISNKGWTLVQ